MSERLALPDPKWRENIEVNSDNLLTYLNVLDVSPFKDRLSFAPDLDLGFFETTLRELHGDVGVIDFTHPPEIRKIFNKSNLGLIPNKFLREIEEERIESWTEIYSNKQPVERYCSVYVDGDDGAIRVSKTVYGGVHQCTSNVFDLLDSGHVPLIEIHSHPSNSLFSNQDYIRMIANNANSGLIRMAKGAIVVCPDVQILALATPHTLFIAPPELDQFTEKYNIDKSETGEQLDHIMIKLGEVFNKIYDYKIQKYIETEQLFSEEDDYYAKGLYTENEFKTAMKNISKTSISEMRDYLPELTQKSDALVAKKARLYNTFEMEIAREVNAKLYISTDFRHFREFTG